MIKPLDKYQSVKNDIVMYKYKGALSSNRVAVQVARAFSCFVCKREPKKLYMFDCHRKNRVEKTTILCKECAIRLFGKEIEVRLLYDG